MLMKKLNEMTRMFLLAATALLLSAPANAQTVGTITPVLVGSTGNFSINGGIMLSSSTGEVMVPTATSSSLILTQGFQQPSANGSLSLNATLVFTNTSCLGAGDGAAIVTPTGGSAPYSYTWSSSASDTFAVNDSLAPGSYTVTVTDAAGLSTTRTFTISETNGLCGVHVYSGLTPNGDGHNDTWQIDYLELFLPNTVYIYNRWGVQVWKGDNYDNNSVVWNGNDQSNAVLPDGTYYYVIEVGQQSMKGWVEISH
jgi:gliding motility-associated-like protein